MNPYTADAEPALFANCEIAPIEAFDAVSPTPRKKIEDSTAMAQRCALALAERSTISNAASKLIVSPALSVWSMPNRITRRALIRLPVMKPKTVSAKA